MYNCSNAFHNAVKNGARQKALLIFSDCVFTDDDISVEEGIEFHDYFNTAEDLCIGEVNSNQIYFSLFNDDRLLNDYTFGDFLATCGVLIGTDTYTPGGTATAIINGHRYVGNTSSPYLTRQGTAVASQPNFGVRSILGYNGKVWVFGNNKQYAVYDDATGANITNANPVNAFMRNKSLRWFGKGFYYDNSARMLYIYQNGVQEEYEFVPFGWFTAERPKAPDVIQIDMTCYDFMQKFETDMPTPEELNMTYPSTIGNLFVKMCNYLGVNYKSSTFINSTAVVSAEPEVFRSSTMRDVLKWIAEAAASHAKFDRDGYLTMAWLKNSAQAFIETDYSEFNPYWYSTRKVTKLYNRQSQGGEDLTVGDGDEGYLIQDNPLLKGVS